MQVKKIVADENIDFFIIKKLRNNGFDILSIMEEYSGITDEEVIRITQERNAILLTEDADFGEWVFAHKIENISVIYLRYPYNERESIAEKLLTLIQNDRYIFEKHFFVLTPKKLRIRTTG